MFSRDLTLTPPHILRQIYANGTFQLPASLVADAVVDVVDAAVAEMVL